MTPIELLAPAKDFECGKAAVLAGADALYMGGPRFGARHKAGNSLSEIARMSEFAHFYAVKVYAAFNTLLFDNELALAQETLWQLYEAGVDALIIQDMGILEMTLPPLPLFASTQTHNMTLEKVQFLEKTGFQRVILARELSLPEMKTIRSQTAIELEAFIHGALCVSHSGRCYLSYALGQRSGNRGDCAQPCREAYTLVDHHGKVLEKNKHFLSLKDLNLSAYLGQLLDSGITSFKIEGRLKDAAYAANVTAYYRILLDELCARKNLIRASAGKSFLPFTPDLYKTFNRGYTSYFISGRQENLGSFDTPKWKGENLGEVIDLGRDWFALSRKASLAPGDGLAFFTPGKILSGTQVNAFKEGKVYPNSMKDILPGTQIYRNYDHAFEKSLKLSELKRKIGVHIKFQEYPQGFSLILQDETGLEVTLDAPLSKTPAQNPDQARASLAKQLSKMGDSPFYPLSFETHLSTPWFFPLSALNELRRSALNTLAAKRKESYERPHGPKIQIVPYFEKTLSFEHNVTNALARKFYQKRGVEQIEPGAEAGTELTGKKLMTLKFCLWYERGICLKEKPGPAYFRLLNAKGMELELRPNCQNCVNELFFPPD